MLLVKIESWLIQPLPSGPILVNALWRGLRQMFSPVRKGDSSDSLQREGCGNRVMGCHDRKPTMERREDESKERSITNCIAMVALYDFVAGEEQDLEFSKGEVIWVWRDNGTHDKRWGRGGGGSGNACWMKGRKNGKVGYLPSNYVCLVGSECK